MNFNAAGVPKNLTLKNTEKAGGKAWTIVETKLLFSTIFIEKDPNNCIAKNFKPQDECTVEWEVNPYEAKKTAVWVVETTLGTESYGFTTT